MRSPGTALAAAAVLALESAALVVFAAIELIGLGAGAATSLPTASALIVLTLIGAVALFFFARGTRSGASWARSGGVVFQVLALAVALAALTVPPVVWPFVLGVGVPAAVGLALLLTSARRESVQRDGDGAADTE